MSNRRIRKTYTISQDNIAVLAELSERYNISESEVVNQIVALFAAEEKARKEANGMLARPQNEGGIFQTKKEVSATQAAVSQDTVPNIDELAPIMRDERFSYDDILEEKYQIHKILKIVSGVDDKTAIILDAINSFLHYLNPNTEYFSAEKQPHSYITEGKAEVAEMKRKAQINAATNK